MAKLFITGASGYIGGEVLYNLVRSHPEYTVRALVRDSSKSKAITAAFPQVQIVEGTLDDASVIARETSNADVILHLAATGHLKSVETIHEALKKRDPSQKPAYWIQISGASAVAAGELADKERIPGSASDLVFDDLDGVAGVRAVIEKHPSRAVDNYILSTAKETQQVNTALVFPPIIYGTGHGPVNQRSVQIPGLAKATLQRKRGLQVGKGLSRWGNVHIHDIGKLILLLVERAVEGRAGDENLWNLNGLYLTGLSDITFGEISRRVADTAAQKGYIPSSTEIDEVLGDEANILLPHGTVLYGTNARSNARRAKELLGWKPEYGSEGLDEEIPKAVEAEAKSLGFV